MDMNIVTPPKKGLKARPYSMDMENHIVTLPKKGLKTRPLNMDKDIVTLPKEDLKTRPYNIGMEKKGLKYDYTKYMDMEKGKPAKRPPKPTRAPPLPSSNDFNLDNDIFQTKSFKMKSFLTLFQRNSIRWKVSN